MNILTSSARFRQRVVKKSYKVGVTEAAKYYRISRNAIYEWRKKYDGKSWKSLLDKSHRPHHHPNEHSTYSSVEFLKKLIKVSPFPIREIQTDNGTEWTRALISNDGKPSLFEEALEICEIKYHRIRVATPRHNGKVERQHRTDEKRFYKKMKMYNLTDGREQLARYNIKSNNIPKICLGFLTPNEMLNKYLGVM